MKLNKRAATALSGTSYNHDTTPAIVALVAFAVQNPGIEAANYCAIDARRASKDWKRFCVTLNEAAALGVDDAQVIAEAPHAFSGRLEWKSHKAHLKRLTDPAKFGGTHKGAIVTTEIDVWDWHYCTGQYFPTEYRAAAATLLEAACNVARRRRPPVVGMPRTITELKERNRENGSHWFDRSTMAFFNCRIESPVIHGCYFITSERMDNDRARKYTVRSFDEKGDVDTVGEFNVYATKADARKALNMHLVAQKQKAA